MPLDAIRAVLLAPDPAARNREIAAHLERMERQLAQTQAAVSGLRALLGGTAPAPQIEFRTIPAVSALAITAEVGWADAVTWGSGAFGELLTSAGESGLTRSGPPGALFPGEFFELERGEITAFVPVDGPVGARALAGRVRRCEIAGIEAAVAVHDGPPDEVDRAYGALGTVVAQRAIGVDGPVREYYPDGLVPGPHRTEICWPVFRTAGA
jgi:effector-binding domain-containing protein